MTAYPVRLEVSPPPCFDRTQLLVRIGIAIVLGWVGITLGALWCLLFLLLPLIAAIVISARGTDYYQQEAGQTVWTGLTWLLGFSAYMLLVVDRVPIDDPHVRVELRTTGRPTVGSALARLVMSIPSVVALCFVGIAACVLWVIAFFSILFRGRVPRSIIEFQTGYLRWQARLAAFHASLVEEYPPFSFADHASDQPTAAVHH